MYKLHKTCRACGNDKLEKAFSLGIQPLANDFRKESEPRAGYAPLDVMFCPQCTLAQLSVVVDPAILYKNYPYVTSRSHTMRKHFDAICEVICRDNPQSVLEIGSNDETFLGHLEIYRGIHDLTGIDPAGKGRRTIQSDLGGAALPNRFYDIIVARHVFCHIDDWLGFFKSIARVCKDSTRIYIEVPYALDQLASGSFDQCYHEHLSFLSIRSIIALLNLTPFSLLSFHRFPIHGGSILLEIGSDVSLTDIAKLSEAIGREMNAITGRAWANLGTKAQDAINQLRVYVRHLRDEGKRICGYGASAKSSVWINACGFTKDDIEFVCDSSPAKVYTTCPGTNIPVAHEGDHFVHCLDYAVLFAWNFADEIISRETAFANGGGKWIVPIPNLKVI